MIPVSPKIISWPPSLQKVVMCPMTHKQFCSCIQTFSPQPALMFYSTNWKPMKKSTAVFCSLQYINGRQRCIGSGHHVWINNVTVPPICLSKHHCKAFPDTGNHGLAGCLMSGHKYQGKPFETGCWPWCTTWQRHTSPDQARHIWRRHFNPAPINPGSADVTLHHDGVCCWLTSSYYSGWSVKAEVWIYCNTSSCPESYSVNCWTDFILE